MSDDIWEVYAVRYAEHQRKAAENYIGGDPHDVLQPLDYFVWVIKNDKRTFLVDTGFDQPVGTKRGRTVITPIDEGLKRLGIEPDKVEDIIISHMHYDHCGNVDMFPRARYHVQDKEMHFCTGRCMCHKQLRYSYEEDYVVSMLRKVFAGRVTFHDGVSEIAPGITLHHIGGHAMGLQSIRVKTKRGFVMLAADAVHLFPHLDEARVFPTTYNLGRGAGRLRDAEAAGALAQSHRAGPRSGGDEDLSGGVGCVEGAGDPPRRRSEGVTITRDSRVMPAVCRDHGFLLARRDAGQARRRAG